MTLEEEVGGGGEGDGEEELTLLRERRALRSNSRWPNATIPFSFDTSTLCKFAYMYAANFHSSATKWTLWNIMIYVCQHPLPTTKTVCSAKPWWDFTVRWYSGTCIWWSLYKAATYFFQPLSRKVPLSGNTVHLFKEATSLIQPLNIASPKRVTITDRLLPLRISTSLCRFIVCLRGMPLPPLSRYCSARLLQLLHDSMQYIFV